MGGAALDSVTILVMELCSLPWSVSRIWEIGCEGVMFLICMVSLAR